MISARLKVLPGLGLVLPFPMTTRNRHGFVLRIVILPARLLTERFVSAGQTTGAKAGKIFTRVCHSRTVLILCTAMPWQLQGMQLLLELLPVTCFFLPTGARAGKQLITTCPWFIQYN